MQRIVVRQKLVFLIIVSNFIALPNMESHSKLIFKKMHNHVGLFISLRILKFSKINDNQQTAY